MTGKETVDWEIVPWSTLTASAILLLGKNILAQVYIYLRYLSLVKMTLTFESVDVLLGHVLFETVDVNCFLLKRCSLVCLLMSPIFL